IDIAQSQVQQAVNKQPDMSSVGSAQLAVTSAQIALDKLTEGADPQAVAIAEAQIKAAQAALDLANYNVSRATLTAPFDGVVAKVNLTPGEPSPVDKPAIVLIDDRGFFVDIPVDEVDIAQVSEGQIAAFAFDSLPGESVTGRVTRIAPTAQSIGDVITYAVH